MSATDKSYGAAEFLTWQDRSTASARSNWLVALRAFGPFEWLTFGYFTWLDAVVLILHRHIAHPAVHLAEQCSIIAGIALLVSAAQASDSRILHLARHWYPIPLYIFCFEELQSLVHAIFPGWFDAALIAFDHAVFGVHPSAWLGRFANPALNDFMQFSYMTYFLYLIVLPALLYAAREYEAFWTTMLSTALAQYCVYVVAVLFPIESPYFSLAALNTAPLTGDALTHLIGLVEHYGRVHGAAFPSAHVAGSTVAILASWRYRRWLFWLCLPFFISMCVATVYGRYHYAADVFAGLLVGWLGFRAGTRWPAKPSS